MNNEKLKKLSECSDPVFRDIYRTLKSPRRIVGDNHFVYGIGDITEMQNAMYSRVLSNYVERYKDVESLEDAGNRMVMRITGDMYNEKTGIGTLSDPSVYTNSYIPIMMGPMECTQLYAPGGLASEIIDKKSIGLTESGVTFKAFEEDIWNNDKINMLEEAVITTGLKDNLDDAIRDAYIFGGSVLYPVFTNDSYLTYMEPMEQLNLQKGCISRWAEVDRWNMSYIPSYDVTAEDYLRPKSIYLPLGGFELSTTRCALIKPKPQPYWSALCNLGWSPSDFTGWIRSLMGYQITVQSIPVMAQQMSLVLYRIPLEELNATLGTSAVEKLMQINEEKMREWSAVNPKAVSMVGEVTVVDRTYSGFDQFLGGMKSDLAAQCGIPEPSIWHTPNKGFSDNTQESLMKESTTLSRNGQYIQRSLTYITDALIAHVFGTDGEEWENRRRLRISFDKPVVSTEKDRAEIGARYSASVASLTQAGVPPDIALMISRQFFPTVKITDEVLADVKHNYDNLQKQNINPAQNGGSGHSLASPGNAGNAGKLVKK